MICCGRHCCDSYCPCCGRRIYPRAPYVAPWYPWPWYLYVPPQSVPIPAPPFYPTSVSGAVTTGRSVLEGK